MTETGVWTVTGEQWDQIEAIFADDGPPHLGLVELMEIKGVFND